VIYEKISSSDQPMASWSTGKTAQQELVEVRLELEYQKQENARLQEKIKKLEAVASKKKSSGTLLLDHTSHSSSSNRRFIRRENEKEEALTTYDFEAFEDFLEDYKDENFQLYFDQDNIAFQSEFFHTFLELKPKLVLDLAIENARIRLQEDPQDSSRIRKDYLLERLDQKFTEYPDCFCSAFEHWIDSINHKYKDKHLYTKEIYEERGDL